jgi:hypothetical protein
VENVVDELAHSLCPCPHALQVSTTLVVETVAVILEQHEAEPVDGSKRRAQIVGQ